MPYPADLPVELVLAIFLEAARLALKDYASWITRLSLVSRATYALVTPVLYHTLVITDSNIESIRVLVDDSRRLGYVRAFCITTTSPQPWIGTAAFARAFGAVVAVDCDSPRLTFHARRVHLRSTSLSHLAHMPMSAVTHLCVDSTTAVRRLGAIVPARTPRSTSLSHLAHMPMSAVTHLCVDYPIGGHRTTTAVRRLGAIVPARTPHDHFKAVFESLPALTHLAFDMGRTATHAADLDDHLGTVLKIILDAAGSRLEALALVVAGDTLALWGRIVHAVASVQDTRLRVWSDGRRIRDAQHMLALRASDARTGRDVWSEARQVWFG